MNKKSIKTGKDVLKYLGVKTVTKALELINGKSKKDKKDIYNYSIEDRKKFSYKLLQDNKDRPKLSKTLQSEYEKNLKLYKTETRIIESQKHRYNVSNKKDLSEKRLFSKPTKTLETESASHKFEAYYHLKFSNALDKDGNSLVQLGENDYDRFLNRQKIFESGPEEERKKEFKKITEEYISRCKENKKAGIDSNFGVKNPNNLKFEPYLVMEDIVK